MKDETLKKIGEAVDKIVIGSYSVMFFPSIIAYKMHGGKLKLKSNEPKEEKVYYISPSIEIKPPRKYESDKEIDYSRIGQNQVREAVRKFVTTLFNNFPPDALITLFKNINDTNISKDGVVYLINHIRHGVCESSGEFSPGKNGEKNTIDLFSMKSIYHELFHAATYNKVDDDTYIVGFEQCTSEGTKGHYLGAAINEGYTELMAHRYFPKEVGDYVSYKDQVDLVKKIEQIVGKEKMEILYLTADLKGFIEEFSKYTDIVSTRNLLSISDTMLLYDGKKDLSHDEREKYLIKINEILVSAFEQKQRMRMESKEITESQYRKEVLGFIEQFPKDVTIHGKIYQLDSDLINGIIGVLNNPLLMTSNKEEGYSK